MSIITDDLSSHFTAARGGGRIASVSGGMPQQIGISVPMQTLASLAQIQKTLPNVGIQHRFAGVGTGLRRNELLVKAASSSNANVANVPPEIRNPLLSLMNFYLPYDRKTLNQWIRYYFKFDPYVKNCCSLNGQFPISDFRLTGITDPAIERAFMEMKERCGLLRHAFEGSQEEEIIGEDITFWQWDEDDVTWDDYTILNPDRLEVREINWGSGTHAFYSLDPPEELKALIRDPDPYVQDMLATLDPVVLEALGSNSRVPLDPFNVTSLMRKDHPYDPRGTSPILAALKCFVSGTSVVMGNGAVKAIEDVQVGDVVMSGEGHPTAVVKTHGFETQEKVVRLRDALCNVVEATADHVMFAFRSVPEESCTRFYGSKKPCPDVQARRVECEPLECERFQANVIQEIAAGDLRPGDYLACPIPKVDEYTSIDLDPWLLGYFVGGGCQMGEWQLAFVGSVDERGNRCLTRVQTELEKLGVKHSTLIERGRDGIIDANVKTSSWRLQFCQQDVRQKFEAALEGLVCKTKLLRQNVLHLPPEQLAEFVQGWIDADGYCTKEGTERISSANERLANQFRYVLLRLGIPASVRKLHQGAKSFGAGNPIWHVSFRREPASRLKFEVFVQDGYVFSKITEKDVYDYTGSVHCVTVADDSHTFIAGGVKVRNCLMYKDKLIEAQYAIADQQITPVQLWKIGDPANGYMATDQQLNDFRNLLQSGAHSPNFAIVTHSAVNLELIGYTGKLLPILPELEWVAKQIMIALNTNEATITGAGPSFGAAVVPFKILQGRYQTKRDRRANVYRQKLFKPFAEARGMWKTTKAQLDHRIRTKKEPIVPGIEWNFKLDLTDNAQKLQYMMQLRDKSGLPMRAICEVMNLDYDNVKRWLKDEEGTVFDPVYQQSRAKRGEQSASTQGLLDVHGGGGGGALPPGGGGGEEAGGEEAGDTEAPEGGEAPPATATIRRGGRRTDPAGELLTLLKVA